MLNTTYYKPSMGAKFMHGDNGIKNKYDVEKYFTNIITNEIPTELDVIIKKLLNDEKISDDNTDECDLYIIRNTLSNDYYRLLWELSGTGKIDLLSKDFYRFLLLFYMIVYTRVLGFSFHTKSFF